MTKSNAGSFHEDGLQTRVGRVVWTIGPTRCLDQTHDVTRLVRVHVPAFWWLERLSLDLLLQRMKNVDSDTREAQKSEIPSIIQIQVIVVDMYIHLRAQVASAEYSFFLSFDFCEYKGQLDSRAQTTSDILT